MHYLCFDMDGTIADLYGYKGWLQSIHNEDATPYRYASPLIDMTALNEILYRLKKDGWKVVIISWLAKNSSKSYNKQVRQAKKEWLARYNFPADSVHIIKYGTTKANSIRKKASYGVLVDDNEKVCKGWTLGKTINPNSTNILAALNDLIREDV